MMRKNPFLPSAQQSGEKSRLTSEERQKIHLGEEARSEARDRLAAEKKTEKSRLTPEEQEKWKEFKYGCLVVLGIVILGSLLSSLFCPRDPIYVEVEARMHCRNYVRLYLDSPEAADFPFANIGSTTERLENNTYRITSHFDAKNVYGTTMRTEYVCTIRFEGDPDNMTEEALELRRNWALIDMKFGKPLPQ